MKGLGFPTVAVTGVAEPELLGTLRGTRRRRPRLGTPSSLRTGPREGPLFSTQAGVPVARADGGEAGTWPCPTPLPPTSPQPHAHPATPVAASSGPIRTVTATRAGAPAAVCSELQPHPPPRGLRAWPPFPRSPRQRTNS